jgi:sarcosine oxidase
MTPRRDVAVVGAGLLGLATARALAALGRDVVVLEQAEIGHGCTSGL